MPAWQLEACVHLSPSSHAVPLAFGVGTHCPVATLQLPTLQASFKPEQSTAVPFWHVNVCRLQVSVPLHGFWSSQSTLVWQGHLLLSAVQPPSFSEQLSTVQAMPSSHLTAVPPHLPAVHTSGVVQVRPSLQTLPSALAGLLQRPVLVSQVPAEWQLSEAVQVTWPAGLHTPLEQASPSVHGFWSLQATPFCFVGFEQMPVAESHTPMSWHWSMAAQLAGAEPTHSPARQLSVCVQALPSLHADLFGFSGLEQAPVTGSHVPATWHWLSAVHTTAPLPTHLPSAQVSRVVHALASSHAVPSLTGSAAHSPVSGTHTLLRHGSVLVGQTTAVPS
jgi:hypothetical protein